MKNMTNQMNRGYFAPNKGHKVGVFGDGYMLSGFHSGDLRSVLSI